MNHGDVIRQSATQINELVGSYGPREHVFDRAAKLASILLNQEITPYEVSMIVTALNLGHLQDNRAEPHNYISAVTNLAFAAQFAMPEPKNADQEMFAGIEEIAKKFAPVSVRMPSMNAPNTEQESPSKEG